MYAYQDKKVEKQLEYEKFLQTYQVQLAALYTVPTGILLSLVSFFGFDRITIQSPINNPFLSFTVLIFCLSFLILQDFLNKTEERMEEIKLILAQIELQILMKQKSNIRK